MDTAKMNSVTEYMCTHEEVAKFFPGVIIRRMSWIDKLLHNAGLKYSFDVVFDETEDDMPTAYFIIQDFEDEKNEITMFLTNIRTIEFFGRTVCVDIYNVEDAVYKMISADSGDGIGLVFFSPSLEDYDDDMMGITPAYTLPIAAHEAELPVLGGLIPALLNEHRKFLNTIQEFEYQCEPEKKADNPHEPDPGHDSDAPDQGKQSEEEFQSGKVYHCVLDPENIEEEGDDLEKPIFSALENTDEIDLLLEEIHESIRDADERLQELEGMLSNLELPFA